MCCVLVYVALNLGTPKPCPSNATNSLSCSTSVPSVSSVLTNSKQKQCLPLPAAHQPLISSGSPYVGEMMSYPPPTLPAFRSAPPLKPVSYITSTSIPKPTPISMATYSSTNPHITKVMPGLGGPQSLSMSMTDKQAAGLPVNSRFLGGIKHEGVGAPDGPDVVMVKGEGLGNMYAPAGVFLQSSGSVETSNLSKMLMTSSQQLTIASTAGTFIVEVILTVIGGGGVVCCCFPPSIFLFRYFHAD